MSGSSAYTDSRRPPVPGPVAVATAVAAWPRRSPRTVRGSSARSPPLRGCCSRWRRAGLPSGSSASSPTSPRSASRWARSRRCSATAAAVAGLPSAWRNTPSASRAPCCQPADTTSLHALLPPSPSPPSSSSVLCRLVSSWRRWPSTVVMPVRAAVLVVAAPTAVPSPPASRVPVGVMVGPEDPAAPLTLASAEPGSAVEGGGGGLGLTSSCAELKSHASTSIAHIEFRVVGLDRSSLLQGAGHRPEQGFQAWLAVKGPC